MKHQSKTLPEPEFVRQIFNQMADEYDNLKDLWYQYTFGYIDQVLQKEFAVSNANGPRHKSLSHFRSQ